MASGNVLAIEPRVNEPSIRRLPFMVRYRAAQMVWLRSEPPVASKIKRPSNRLHHHGHVVSADSFKQENINFGILREPVAPLSGGTRAADNKVVLRFQFRS